MYSETVQCSAINQLINQSINQSVNQPVSQSVSQSLIWLLGHQRFSESNALLVTYSVDSLSL